MNQIKSGFLTSEFWMALTNNIVGIVVALGYLTPAQADDFSKAVVSVVGGVVVIASTVMYVVSRIKLKSTEPTSSTQIDGLLGVPKVEEPDTIPKIYPN